MTREEIVEMGYKYHHSSLAKGYHSRKYETVYEYSGKFGEGYTIERNDRKTNNYHIKEYYIK